MYKIEKLSVEKHFKEYSEIVSNAYPGFKIETMDQKNKFVENSMKTQEESSTIKFYGVFEQDKLVGGMRYHYFKMNLLGKEIKAGGLGLVGVHLLHKKEKIAKAIVEDYIKHFRDQGNSMVMLYPFRPDFYKNMGFGFGTSMNQYKIKPMNLPKGPSKSHIMFVAEERMDELYSCYARMYNKTNGLIEQSKKDFLNLLINPKVRIVACEKNRSITGFIVFEFKTNEDKGSLVNDMVITKIIFEDREALSELMTFLNSQSDQIRHIIINTQDEDFRFLLDDPRDDSDKMFVPVYHQCSVQGTGIMYRVTDVKMLFNELKDHNFNNENCRLKLTIIDTFISENNGSVVVNFENGIARIEDSEEYDVEVTLDIADFSSLVTCAVSFKSLYRFGRALISNEEYINKINNIFSSDNKPICLTVF